MKQALEAEFTAFVADRGQALLRIAHAMTGDRQAAEDLVQGALAKAYARWPRIHGEAEAYVRRIIYNDRISTWRRAGNRNEVTVAEVPDRPQAGRHEQEVTSRLALRAALLSLPVRQRAVLVMRYLEDRTVEETAEVLGCRPGTVASQASRALAKLRDVFGVDDWTEATR
ncbi:RNA polymerase subunit sigma-70 [Actinoplanes sp. SE50]|uniref:SigE family RNA polymerase sigma factor n=1 Tax=unclassified Actinoplanes TaxID=2626549 RepID=UPI00023EDDEE|nr:MULTISPECIES: SigE family RNA polymerase sigma factor [unclassified Actinoplanes]AEV89239.1 RNA polymerase sigma-E factor [Actinoplanes sp. SE50/110]ATO87645.1 RNA polymerase subunit sigma-70 [Actinoplanes sp. SE50]SLM05064.1 DNA-directed RNA polymerase sigma-70 factor [Actinoplanes sp. SE50/110]